MLDFARKCQWTFGLVDAPISAFLEPHRLPPVRWFPRPVGRFFADPFGWVDGTDLCVVVEDYDYAQGAAHLSMMRLDGKGRVRRRAKKVLDVGVHASYPYAFQHEGRFYCVPETAEANEVALYDATGPRWRRLHALLPGFPAVDSTVIRHEGRWWLLCTRAGARDCSDLFAFYADDLRGRWRAHAKNPIRSDPLGSRPAGTPFVHGGALYRPAQDCTLAYGQALVIQRVLELTPERFREETAVVVRPDPDGPYPHGLHTLSAVGDRTLVDGNRWIRAHEDPWLVLGASVGSFHRALRRRLS